MADGSGLFDHPLSRGLLCDEVDAWTELIDEATTGKGPAPPSLEVSDEVSEDEDEVTMGKGAARKGKLRRQLQAHLVRRASKHQPEIKGVNSQ